MSQLLMLYTLFKADHAAQSVIIWSCIHSPRGVGMSHASIFLNHEIKQHSARFWRPFHSTTECFCDQQHGCKDKFHRFGGIGSVCSCVQLDFIHNTPRNSPHIRYDPIQYWYQNRQHLLCIIYRAPSMSSTHLTSRSLDRERAAWCFETVCVSEPTAQHS